MAVVYAKGGTQTPVGGTFSVSIPMPAGELGQIYVAATTASTRFDAKLVDIFGNTIFHAINVTGKLSDFQKIPLHEAMITLTILNATVNEPFSYLLKEIQEM